MNATLETRIIPFDIDYLRARARFQRHGHNLIVVHDTDVYRFLPARPVDAARMGFYKILLKRLCELPEDERMKLRLKQPGIHPTHYIVSRQDRGIDLQFALRPKRADQPATYQASTSLRSVDPLLSVENETPLVGNVITPGDFRRELRQALRQSYAHLGIEAYCK